MNNAKDIPPVREMLSIATRLLGFDLLDVCLHGPPERLQQIDICHPAVFVGGL
eukprot:CAMPEP_0194541212 /NCGR_PEP_ID=MMETSP0253-20130528/81819_1 /TAXON_ID=2966 /ORGANISM="Noctiluca scintillans" /LENGTH=52 /DNA_ID=CAMNT_0039387679 /DNA_START=24 /DNA_END=179 /DNA_ORIENTATION=+